jgi:anhydro-N-acetylmuramic acid kinase
MDAIDAVLAKFDDRRTQIRATHSHKISRDVLTRLRQVVEHPAEAGLVALGELDTALGRDFAAAAGELLAKAGQDPAGVRAIGSHGQTVYHAPRGDYPFSIQIGDPNTIAARTGITTVADFRRRDMALGGQGAPLVPAFHQAMFSSPDEPRAVLNLGGIANLTLLLPGRDVTGFDTGPGNTLMDGWTRLNLGQPFDVDGAWAASAEPDEALIEKLMSNEFFALAPPKSTGIEDFNIRWLQRILDARRHPTPPAMVQASLVQLSARSAAQALHRACPEPGRLLICGGGAHNRTLVDALGHCLPKWRMEQTDLLGIGVDWVEAAAFAWLAHLNLEAQPGNVPSVTGASREAVLGAIYPG